MPTVVRGEPSGYYDPTKTASAAPAPKPVAKKAKKALAGRQLTTRRLPLRIAAARVWTTLQKP